MKQLLVLLSALGFITACNSGSETADAKKQGAIACPPGSKVDVATIESITGMKGVEKNGEYKITVPQNDLHMMVDGFKIIPPMGLSSWVAFTPCGDSAMVMGDLILTEIDLKWIQQEVIAQGFAITAIHNHFVRNRPTVMYMHIDRKADITTLANGVKAILNRIKEIRGVDPAAEKADSVENTLNVAQLDALLGQKGEMNKGVYKYTIGRPDVQLMEHGIPVSSFMGFNTWAAWQGTPDRAAVCGDFVMLENEVAPVIKELVIHGLEVVAVHNHMVHEEPKTFFLHYWGVGNMVQMAQGIKSALDETGKGGAVAH
ncbi:hypothetical protein A4H97_24070 [Niastella yeongjuensis]|uniref:Peptidase M23 n=1 Tax=Niastella yeongjuensis TaxID=354355 RepID=A0A1V9F3C9_9BACT|nr:DUF1259 domain-containing protein [Niastella yeongjuensis]OQP52782.1 hypothetical protein A4H97_24070 [Niastella yeongjuensis]SEP19619.1 protein of unknown function [Niastella yeongjuensis]